MELLIVSSTINSFLLRVISSEIVSSYYLFDINTFSEVTIQPGLKKECDDIFKRQITESCVQLELPEILDVTFSRLNCACLP